MKTTSYTTSNLAYYTCPYCKKTCMLTEPKTVKKLRIWRTQEHWEKLKLSNKFKDNIK